MIQYYYSPDCIWFRIFGVGMHVIDRSKNPPLYSVRSGAVKEYRIGKWAFKLLGKEK